MTDYTKNVNLNTLTDLPSLHTPIGARAEEWALGCESENSFFYAEDWLRVSRRVFARLCPNVTGSESFPTISHYLARSCTIIVI